MVPPRSAGLLPWCRVRPFCAAPWCGRDPRAVSSWVATPSVTCRTRAPRATMRRDDSPRLAGGAAARRGTAATSGLATPPSTSTDPTTWSGVDRCIRSTQPRHPGQARRAQVVRSAGSTQRMPQWTPPRAIRRRIGRSEPHPAGPRSDSTRVQPAPVSDLSTAVLMTCRYDISLFGERGLARRVCFPYQWPTPHTVHHNQIETAGRHADPGQPMSIEDDLVVEGHVTPPAMRPHHPPP
jgi:hypothetical protein